MSPISPAASPPESACQSGGSRTKNLIAAVRIRGGGRRWCRPPPFLILRTDEHPFGHVLTHYFQLELRSTCAVASVRASDSSYTSGHLESFRSFAHVTLTVQLHTLHEVPVPCNSELGRRVNLTLKEAKPRSALPAWRLALVSSHHGAEQSHRQH